MLLGFFVCLFFKSLWIKYSRRGFLFFFFPECSRRKKNLFEDLEFWALPKIYHLRKQSHTKSKKSNKEVLCITNQKHVHNTQEQSWKGGNLPRQAGREIPPCLLERSQGSTQDQRLECFPTTLTPQAKHGSLPSSSSPHLVPTQGIQAFLIILWELLKLSFPFFLGRGEAL